MPYEVYAWDPKSGESIPDWFSDILKLKYFDENGNPEFQYSKDKYGITYQIPATNGHLFIKTTDLVLKDLGTGIIFPFKRSLFNKLYYEKIGKWGCIINYIKKMTLRIGATLMKTMNSI